MRRIQKCCSHGVPHVVMAWEAVAGSNVWRILVHSTSEVAVALF